MIAQLCNNNRFVNVISTGPDLYIEFAAGNPSLASKSSSNFAQGFQAKYHFYDNKNVTSNLNVQGSSRELSNRRGSLSSSEASSSSPSSIARDTLIPGTGKTSCRRIYRL